MADMWHVISQAQDLQISDTGPGFDKIWTVKYRIDSGPAAGTVGTVNIPAATHNAETVKMAIDAAVYHLDQVAGL